MIQLSNTSIMIFRADGSTIPFDVEEVQTRIIRACIAAGETESWIAGDISLSIEFALLSTKNRTIKESDLESMVVRALEDSGYPHVASDFKRNAVTSALSDIPVNEKTVLATIAPTLSLPDEKLEIVAAKVMQALLGIGFETCSPRLMVELARHYRDRDQSSTPVLRLPSQPLKPGDDVMLLKPSDFHALASVNLKDLLTGGSLRIHGVSRLFAALKIDISLIRFADAMELSKPVSELALLSTWGRLVMAIDEICEKAEHFCRTEQEPVALPLPLCLTFRDADKFAVSRMNCPKAVTEECVHGLITDFTGGLRQKPFKINID